MRYWIEMAFFLHLVFCVINLYELVFESKVKAKVKFAAWIILFPVVGIILFERSKKVTGISDYPSIRSKRVKH